MKLKFDNERAMFEVQNDSGRTIAVYRYANSDGALIFIHIDGSYTTHWEAVNVKYDFNIGEHIVGDSNVRNGEVYELFPDDKILEYCVVENGDMKSIKQEVI